MFLPYVYILTNRNTKEFYIGMRAVNTVVAEEDLGIEYFSSSKNVKDNFSDFDTFIVAYFKDQISAFEFENDLIKEHWGNRLLLNKHYQKSMSSFSMAGTKRPDLAAINRATKSKPKETRQYVCALCKTVFSKLEFAHHQLRINPMCSYKCSNTVSARTRKSQKGISKTCAAAGWNKGKTNSVSAANAKKGASKLSAMAKGRKRKYNEDGTWTWFYPDADPA